MSAAAIGTTVPYVARWSGERKLPGIVMATSRRRVEYLDESLSDRDSNGVLWARWESRPGVGKPLLGQIHSTRQRRVMRNLLCQVCAGQPDRNDDGVLWVMTDRRNDWAGWPDGVETDDAPVCLPCARTSARLCPGLRGRMVFVRSKTHPIVGVRGACYILPSDIPGEVKTTMVGLDDLAIRWTVAHQLSRELLDCVIVGTDVDRL